VSRSLSILTVATVSHVAPAVATLRTARRHHLQARFHLFVVDATNESIAKVRKALSETDRWIHAFGPTHLTAEREQFLAAFKQYNAIELSCLAKYVAVAHLMRTCDDDSDLCVVLDGDVLIVGPLDEALDEIGDKAVLLTPHLLGPTGDDTEHDIMMHGWINAGFLAFRWGEPARVALDWLIDRISRRGYLAPQFGMSCDQKWVSGLPILFRNATAVSAHPGVNLGYWNVAERPLTRRGDTMFALDRPLLLVHFSGFAWPQGGLLSKHASYRVPVGSPLEDLCRAFRAELEGAAAVAAAMSGLPAYSCSKATLLQRIRIGSDRTGVVLPTALPGVFTRIGSTMDSLVRRLARIAQ
jgi:hypothetical protein